MQKIFYYLVQPIQNFWIFIVFRRRHQSTQYKIKIIMYNGLLTVRWAGRCCGHGGCYANVSCACYGTHSKISNLFILDSILKYRKNRAFSYSGIELQGQINDYTSTPWKKNSDTLKFKLKWWPKWTEASFTSQTLRWSKITLTKAFEN